MDTSIKKTQNSLGKIVKRPPLTDKLLSKPPFRFLHDIVTSVIKQTGFAEGLFSPEELESQNVTEKHAKMKFLQKLIDLVCLVNDSSLAVRPNKVVAGQEPEKTNEFLQALAAAINKKVDMKDYVPRVLNDSKDGPKRDSKNQENHRTKPSRDIDKSSDRDRGRERHHRNKEDSEHREKGDKSKEQRGSAERNSKRRNKNDRESSRHKIEETSSKEPSDIDLNDEPTEPLKRTYTKVSSKKNTEPVASNKYDKSLKKVDFKKPEKTFHNDKETLKSRKSAAHERSSRSRSGNSASRERRSKHQPAPEIVEQKQEPLTNGDLSDENLKPPRPSSAKGSRRRRAEGRKRIPDDEENEGLYLRDVYNDIPEYPAPSGSDISDEPDNTNIQVDRQASARPDRRRPPPEAADLNNNRNEQQQPQSHTKTRRNKQEKKPESISEEPKLAPARRAARPPSARIGSSRPAPPRPAGSTGVGGSLSASVDDDSSRADSGKRVTVIRDNAKDSDDEDSFIVEDSMAGVLGDEDDQLFSSQTQNKNDENDDDEDHGGLVRKILETKKGLTQQSSKTDSTPGRMTASDAQRRKERELIEKEVDKLKVSIQSLTRSVNPLGKIMDFIQEDVDSMQKELEYWRNENKQHSQDLKKEMNTTNTAIEPLKAQLSELDSQIKDMLDSIYRVKGNIALNEDRIQSMAGSILNA